MRKITDLLSEVGEDPLSAARTLRVRLEFVDRLPGSAMTATDGDTVWATDIVSAWAGLALVIARRFGVELSCEELAAIATARIEAQGASAAWRITDIPQKKAL